MHPVGISKSVVSIPTQHLEIVKGQMENQFVFFPPMLSQRTVLWFANVFIRSRTYNITITLPLILFQSNAMIWNNPSLLNWQQRKYQLLTTNNFMRNHHVTVNDQNLFKILSPADVLSADKLCNYKYILHVNVLKVPNESCIM